jgi:ArsR family transcriptional regulator, arsenate/arsenite/antimonite-responsive transcriptional repressor
MEINYAVVALSALAQDTRLEIFRLLVRTGPEGVSAGAIADRCSLPAPTLSFHLAQLKHAGLITCRRDGRSLIYSANYRAMTALMEYLTENCCGGRPEICAPAACQPGAADSIDATQEVAS